MRTRLHRLVLLVGGAVLGAVVATAAGAADPEPGLVGFSAAGAAAERALEQRFDAGLAAGDLRGWLERMAAEPNQVGSPHDKANAEFTLEQFKAWGWDAHIETFSVLYPTPKTELLELSLIHI